LIRFLTESLRKLFTSHSIAEIRSDGCTAKFRRQLILRFATQSRDEQTLQIAFAMSPFDPNSDIVHANLFVGTRMTRPTLRLRCAWCWRWKASNAGRGKAKTPARCAASLGSCTHAHIPHGHRRLGGGGLESARHL